MVQLDTIAIVEADGCVRTEGRDGELFREISPKLKTCSLLIFGLVCLRLSESSSCNLTGTGTTRSRPGCTFAIFRLDSGGWSAGRFRGRGSSGAESVSPGAGRSVSGEVAFLFGNRDSV